MAVGQPSASSSAAVPSASTSAAAQNASKRAAAAAPALAATVDYAAIEAARKAAHEKVKKAVEDYMAFEHEERARKEREKQLQQAEQRAGEKAVWKRARIGGKDKVLLTMKQVRVVRTHVRKRCWDRDDGLAGTWAALHAWLCCCERHVVFQQPAHSRGGLCRFVSAHVQWANGWPQTRAQMKDQMPNHLPLC